jgi:hypothetical protein
MEGKRGGLGGREDAKAHFLPKSTRGLSITAVAPFFSSFSIWYSEGLNVSVAVVVGCQLQPVSEEPVKNELLEGHRTTRTTTSTTGYHAGCNERRQPRQARRKTRLVVIDGVAQQKCAARLCAARFAPLFARLCPLVAGTAWSTEGSSLCVAREGEGAGDMLKLTGYPEASSASAEPAAAAAAAAPLGRVKRVGDGDRGLGFGQLHTDRGRGRLRPARSCSSCRRRRAANSRAPQECGGVAGGRNDCRQEHKESRCLAHSLQVVGVGSAFRRKNAQVDAGEALEISSWVPP